MNYRITLRSSWLLPFCTVVLFSGLLCGCGDGGGPVASDDEITNYLNEHPELVKDLDSETAVIAAENSGPRPALAAP
jgi:hypothetical protein